MNRKFSFAVVTLTLAAAVGVIIWQHSLIQQLRAQLTAVYGRLQAQRDETEQLIGAANASNNNGRTSQAEQRELLRLRGELTKAHAVQNENERLKRALSDAATRSTPSISPDNSVEQETDEQKIARAYARYARDIATAWIELQADGHPAPQDLSEPALLQHQRMADGDGTRAHYGLNLSQFELVYHATRAELQEPNRTILVRQRQPIRTSDGRWQKIYGLADGTGQIVTADTRDGFAAKEKENGWIAIQ